jgi:hypothetical protein
MEDVQNYVWELKMKRWSQKANNREEWPPAATEAMVLRGPSRQGVNIYVSIINTPTE